MNESMASGRIVFLMVEDSEHDITAFKRAWSENGIENELRIVRNGRECLDYLHRRGRFKDEENTPRPEVILLNNKLPKTEGLSVLDTIRQTTEFANIPVIIFTSSESNRKEKKSYKLGANAYVVKPMQYCNLSETVRRINDFWELVEVPEDL
jgi:CheY-like chemotaxis protein